MNVTEELVTRKKQENISSSQLYDTKIKSVKKETYIRYAMQF